MCVRVYVSTSVSVGCVRVCVFHVCLCVGGFMCMCVCVCVSCVCVCVCFMCVCVGGSCVCVCVCMCVYFVCVCVCVFHVCVCVCVLMRWLVDCLNNDETITRFWRFLTEHASYSPTEYRTCSMVLYARPPVPHTRVLNVALCDILRNKSVYWLKN